MEMGITPGEIENQRKRLLIYVFAGVGGLFLAAFGIVSLVNGRYLLGAVLLLLLVFDFATACAAKFSSNVRHISYFLGFMLLVLSVYLVLSGGAEGTGVYWSYTTSMLMVLVVGPAMGIAMMAVYFLLLSVGLFGDFSGFYPYTAMEASRIVATSFALYVLVLASEKIRIMSYGAITFTSEIHRRLANTDALTQVLNRYGLESLLKDKEHDAVAVVALLDIDHFKQINDRFGHAAGDKVLVTLANTLLQHTKGRDLVSRWGGEEFLLVLFDTDLGSAFNLVDKIRQSFSQQEFVFNEQVVSVSFSAGLSVMATTVQFEQASKLSDQHLYQAKTAGRNCVHCAARQLASV
jgi:diguanylate cyclase (GGDEF)-like protein